MEQYQIEFIPDQIDEPQEPNPIKKTLRDLFETLVLSLILFLIINAVSARIRIESVSMLDTLNPGDFVFVNKIAYKINDPDLGDVVVFEPPFDSAEPYIKRVIGRPGDEVRIENGRVYINDQLIIESYIRENTSSGGTWEVPEDSLFVMGDNRGNSSDSRSWGMVPSENVIGEALFVYWPPEQWGALSQSAVAAEPTPIGP